MTLIQFNESQDIVTTKLDTSNAQFTVSTSAVAAASSVWIFVANSTTGGYLPKPDTTSLSASNVSISAAFRQLANFFFGTGAYINDSYDGVTQLQTVRVIQIGRPLMDEGFYPSTITATIQHWGASGAPTGSGGTTGTPKATLTAYDSQNLSSVNSPLGLTGAMIDATDADNIVGTVFYDHGVIVFHGGKTATQNWMTSSSAGFCIGQSNGVVTSPSFSADTINLKSLVAQTRNVVKRTVYFTRGFNRDFNFTTNPTARTADGYIVNSLTANPTTFITTVGLYDDTGNLLAIGKVNPPKRKDQYNEVLFKVQLDF